MSNDAEKAYASAVNIMESDDSYKEKALPLLFESIEKGLKSKIYEARAYCYIGNIFSKKEEVDKALNYYKKAILIKKSIREDASIEQSFWKGAYSYYASILCLRASEAEKHSNFDQAINYLREAIEFTDWPEAHNRLAKLYLIEKKDKTSAFKHWRYIINNRDKLSIFEKDCITSYENAQNQINIEERRIIELSKENINQQEKINKLLISKFRDSPYSTLYWVAAVIISCLILGWIVK